MAGEEATELIRLTLMRARFCELMEPYASAPASDLFLVGLLSLLDAMLDQPMSVVIEQVPISPDCRDALTGTKNSLSDTLVLAIACERGDWDALPQLCDALNCSESQAFQRVVEAQGWACDLLPHTEF